MDVNNIFSSSLQRKSSLDENSFAVYLGSCLDQKSNINLFDNPFLTSRSTSTNSTTLYDKIGEDNLASKLKYLEEELHNAHADKEFVWSLWKQLQSSNPDLTSAISQVVQREKEKAEIKDRKILEILKIKDAEINQLEQQNKKSEIDINNYENKLKIFELELYKKDEEIQSLKLDIQTVKDKEVLYEQMIRLRDDKYSIFLKESESKNKHFNERVQEYLIEIEKLKESEKKLKNENEEFTKTNKIIQEKIFQEKTSYDKLSIELNNLRSTIDENLQTEIDRLKNELNMRYDAEKNIKKELNELSSKLISKQEFINEQEKIIKQLRHIQMDLIKANNAEKETNRIIKDENENIKNNYNQINQKYQESLENEKRKINENLDQASLEKNQKFYMERLAFKEKYLLDLIEKIQYHIKQPDSYNYFQKNMIGKIKQSSNRLRKIYTYSFDKKKFKSARLSLNKKATYFSKDQRTKDIKRSSFYQNDKKFNQINSTNFKIPSSKRGNEIDQLCISSQHKIKKLSSPKTQYNLIKDFFNFHEKEKSSQLKKKSGHVNHLKLMIKDFKAEILDRSEKSKDKNEMKFNKHIINESQAQTKSLKMNEKHRNELKIETPDSKNDYVNYSDLNIKLTERNKILRKKCSKLQSINKKFCKLLIQNYKKHKESKVLFINCEKMGNNFGKKLVNDNDSNTRFLKKSPGNLLLSKKHDYEKLIKIKTESEKRYKVIKNENSKLLSEADSQEAKIRKIKNQLEICHNEVSYLKKRESEYLEREKIILKQGEDQNDAIKKSLNSKIKALGAEIKKHIDTNKKFKNEIENLNDKIKIVNDRTIHLERDNSQKKQLIEFYKKRLEELSEFKCNIESNDFLNEFKNQITKLNSIIDSLKERCKVSSKLKLNKWLFLMRPILRSFLNHFK
jgi:centlein